jgi:tripartite-type tricarboxylate transporter receptor subunit TctC
MTWQGGKLTTNATAAPPPFAFARLKALISAPNVDVGTSLKNAAQALRDFGSQVHIHVQFVANAAGDKVDHWQVDGGTPTATATQGKPASADVHVVMLPETWTQIASGQLAPYNALFGGKVRVGGNLETAKRIVQHLSDPTVPYIPPC